MRADKDFVIEEGLDENEELSESMALPQTPSPRVGQFVINHTSKGINKIGKFSQNTSAAHTRANSSKAQSLKGSIVIQKPSSSQYLSVASSTTQIAEQDHMNKSP